MKHYVALLPALALLAGTAQGQTTPDLSQAIRKEGLERSRAMTYVADLSDGIGARLTGSPNLRKAYSWARERLTEIGASDVHLEDIGEFGLSWQVRNAWLRMTVPDAMIFQAQPSPWSVATKGPQQGDAIAVSIASTEDFVRYRGSLRGKVVLLGPLREVPLPTTPFATRWTSAEVLDGSAVEPQRRYYQGIRQRWESRAAARKLLRQTRLFLQQEGVKAVILPSPETDATHGGTGLVTAQMAFSEKGWTAATRAPFPVFIANIENFGRAWRLASTGKRVSFQYDIDAPTYGTREHAYNIVAEIPGTDPALKSEVVMIGAHLDSWTAGTGATDDAVGVATCLEVLRILRTVGALPRRTIRVVLFAGEEQGTLGSKAYVERHFARSIRALPPRDGEILARNDVQTLPDYDRLSAYFNVDRGGGRIRAVYAGDNRELGAVFGAWIKPLSDLGVETVVPGRSFPADQATFEQVGLPGIVFLQDLLGYYSRSRHSNLDTVEHVEPADLAQMATVVTILALATANRDERLPRLSLP